MGPPPPISPPAPSLPPSYTSFPPTWGTPLRPPQYCLCVSVRLFRAILNLFFSSSTATESLFASPEVGAPHYHLSFMKYKSARTPPQRSTLRRHPRTPPAPISQLCLSNVCVPLHAVRVQHPTSHSSALHSAPTPFVAHFAQHRRGGNRHCAPKIDRPNANRGEGSLACRLPSGCHCWLREIFDGFLMDRVERPQPGARHGPGS